MDFSRGMTPSMFAVSLASAVGSMTVVASILLFRKELLKKPSTEAVFYIFISNVLTSFGSLVGFPVDGSFACWFEGLVTNIFTLSSVLWTIVVTLMLYSVLVSRNPMKIYLSTHGICWGIPLLVTFLPFINSSYGAPDGLGWCWVVTTDDAPTWAPQLWYWLSYYGWLWLSFIVIVVVSILIVIKVQSVMPSTRQRFKKAFFKLSGYPVIIFICWIGSTFTDFISAQNPTIVISDEVLLLTTVLDCLMGLLSAIYFWIHEDSLRDKMWIWYQSGFKHIEIAAKGETSKSSIVSEAAGRGSGGNGEISTRVKQKGSGVSLAANSDRNKDNKVYTTTGDENNFTNTDTNPNPNTNTNINISIRNGRSASFSNNSSSADGSAVKLSEKNKELRASVLQNTPSPLLELNKGDDHDHDDHHDDADIEAGGAVGRVSNRSDGGCDDAVAGVVTASPVWAYDDEDSHKA